MSRSTVRYIFHSMLEQRLSLFNFQNWSSESLLFFLDKAKRFKSEGIPFLPQGPPPVVLLAFLEPSTRTKLSFQMSCHRLGYQTLVFEPGSTTSSVKGESDFESLKNLLAMRPDMFVLRHNRDSEWEKALWAGSHGSHVISAGAGVRSHPTQALLDLMTIWELFPRLSPLNIVFIGDVRHSRVARSHMELLSLWEDYFSIRVCAPKELWPDTSESLFKRALFSESTEDVLPEAHVVIVLRPQKERHEGFDPSFWEQYARGYCMKNEHIDLLPKGGVLLHPGPFNPHLDLDPVILSRPQVKMYLQVENAVYLRAALLDSFWKKELLS